jgi:AraC-like DNA-binding protein
VQTSSIHAADIGGARTVRGLRAFARAASRTTRPVPAHLDLRRRTPVNLLDRHVTGRRPVMEGDMHMSLLMDSDPATEDEGLPHASSIRTTDPYEARVRTQEFLDCSHRMAVLGRDTPFLARVDHRSLGGLGLMSSEYGPPVEIGCSPPIPLVTVNFVFDGHMLIDDGGRTAVADAHNAAAFCFHEDLEMRWTQGMRQLMLTIEKTRVERFLRNLLNEPLSHPLHLDPHIDLAGRGQGIAAAVLTLRRALACAGEDGPAPVLAAEIEHNVLTTLLLGHRHSYSDALFSTRRLPTPRVVRRVVELVDSTPEKAFTVADLAAYAGVSERSLHAAFRRQLGTSPMSYVRSRRLEQAHDELVDLDPSCGVRVIDVALRYGFTHAGRFAAAYRRRFGESPSTTLRR